MRQETMATTIATNNCLEFEAGDFRLKVPDSAMNDYFKTSMGLVAGVSVGVVMIMFGREIIRLLDTNRVPMNYYQYQQQPYAPMYYYPQQ